MTEKRVYLDYAATAPMLTEVRSALCADECVQLGNASSLYSEGRNARQALENARIGLATFLGCSPLELYFCSGGTEAAGTLVEGMALGALDKQGEQRARKHIICAAFEHHAVLNSVLSLKRAGFDVTLLSPNREGRITPESLEAALREDTLLVTVALAQNELGIVQDIKKLSKLTHKAGALFMSDCVQALGKLPFSLADLNIDGACFSAHKLGGPLGVGAFFLKPRIPFRTRQLGGGQEQNHRSGTQNVAGVLGFELAARLHSPTFLAEEGIRLAHLRDTLLDMLTTASTRIRSTVSIASGDTQTHLPGYLHLLVEGIESQTMVLKLDEMGFAVSGGSACSTGSLEPSHVLTSMGISKDEAYGALRISMGRSTTLKDIEDFGKALLSLLI